jgi:glycosyltransferase involved in cell wall biosynthesis
VLLRLASGDDELADHALLALHDRQLVERPVTAPTGPGIRIGQVFVHTDFGGGDDRAGAGDDGGIATLLTVLAGELGRLDGVADVVSIGRGGVADALVNGWPRSVPGGGGAAIPFGAGGRVDLRRAWPHRVEIERGMRRVVRTLPGLDLLHLRMADVGTLAAARVARRHGVPIVFTAAPDPHGVLDALAAEGRLPRAGFGDTDHVEHWWFRARMVERLAVQADHIVLLPRPDVRRTVARYLGTGDLAEGSTIVAEGVHAATVRRARAEVAGHALRGLGPTVDDLVAALRRMPRRRRRLPLVVSVGRLHPAKGMTRVVRAWRDSLASVANLVIVGGDLVTPSVDEQRVLDEIRPLASARHGLILLGRRPHAEVATLLEVAAGRAKGPLPCGVYVAGSTKEEFGLAIVEALAAGLPVVAPAAGGPSTYVTDGVDGVLVADPSDDALAVGMRRAFDLAPVPGRAAQASAKVLGGLTIERMAASLRDVYVGVAAGRVAAAT